MPADSLLSVPHSEHTSESSPEPKKKPRIFSLRLGNRRRRSNSHQDASPPPPHQRPLSNSNTSFSAPRSPSFLPQTSFFGSDFENSPANGANTDSTAQFPRSESSPVVSHYLTPTQPMNPTNSLSGSPPPLPSGDTGDAKPLPTRSTPLTPAEKRFSHHRSLSADQNRSFSLMNALQPTVTSPPSTNNDGESDISEDSDSSLPPSIVAPENKVPKECVRFSLMLNEAAADTPSFRASATYLSVMFADFEQWLQRFADQTNEVVAKLNSVKLSVNEVISLFMPGATHSSIFAQDYTTLAFGRYTEAGQVFWTDLFVRVAKNAQEVVQMVKRLRQTVFARYHHAQQRYTRSLAELEASSLDLFKLPLHAERAAQREATHRFHTAQKRHWHAATKLVAIVADLEAECTVSLLETLSQHYMAPAAPSSGDTDRLAISIEMHRLQQAAVALRSSLPKLSDELRERRHHLRQQQKDAANFRPFDSEFSQDTHYEWVRAELKPGKWQLVWAFMQNGMFGFLGLSENGTAVVESPKVVANSARFEVVENEECRYAFRVMNIDSEWVTVQATSAPDRERWQQAFAQAIDHQTLSRSGSAAALATKNGKLPLLKRNSSILSQNRLSKRSLAEYASTNATNANANTNTNANAATNAATNTTHPDLNLSHPDSRANSPEPAIAVAPSRWSAMDLRPWNPSFSLEGWQGRVSPDSDLVVSKIDELRNDMQRTRGLKFDSTLTSRGSMDFDLRIPAVMPLPTSVQLEAVVANSFFRPEYTCNAITANLWGATGQHRRAEDANTAKTPLLRPNTFPSYPNNYASSLMVQDMDMRCMVSQLPRQFAMLPDEVMLTLVRGVHPINNIDTPVRLYVTNHRLLVYGTWHGMVSISCYPVTSLMDIEASHGVDYSVLRIFAELDQNPHARNQSAPNQSAPSQSAPNQKTTERAVSMLEFRLFIDSAVLAKRKIDYIKENSRLASPEDCHDLLDALAVIAIEHGENQKRHESEIAREIQSWPQPVKREVGAPWPAIASTEECPHPSLASYILAAPVGVGSNRGEEDALRLGNGMNTKLGEDTYPLTVDALFLVMFGAKSDVFGGEHAGFMPSECKVGYWYRRGRRLERRIKERYQGLGLDYENRFNVQRVDRRHPDLFIVTEKRAPWQIPEGDRFYTLIKYVAYATAGGCHLQMWLKIVWLDQKGNLASEKSVEQSMKATVKSINLNTRRAAQKVHSVDEARTLYGSVKPEKVLAGGSHDREEDPDLKVTKITKRVLILMFIQTYWKMSKNFRRTMRRQAWHYIKISVPKIILLLLVLLSLLANMVLYQRYRGQYWQAELERSDVDALIKQLRLAPTQQCTFSRAIYTSDVDDMLRSSSLWHPPHAAASDVHHPLANYQQNSSSRCFQKFSEIAQLSLVENGFGALYKFEPHVQTVLSQISDTRYEYAVKRNELMTMLNMLNHQELDDLQRVYQNWLISETQMCSEARRALPLLETSASEAITAYCLSCLHEAKNLY